MDVAELLGKAKQGFSALKVDEDCRKAALESLQAWLEGKEFEAYRPQLVALIKKGQWDLLLDSFYQVIPFGTGGRRGPVGIGPNRLNVCTVESSAQGHAQYLLKKYGKAACDRGVVLAYDVRKFDKKGVYDDSSPNPVMGLSGVDLARAAACVYAASDIKVFLFDAPRSTPELAFAIRHLKAVAGDVFSASHNPPTDNGKKVYDEHGGQLIPPHDQELVDEVTQNVKEVERVAYGDAKKKGLVEEVGAEVDEAYVAAVLALSLGKVEGVRVLYSPLHGCGLSSVYEVLKKAKVAVTLDAATSNPSGAFEHVTFNIPNPEVSSSFDTLLAAAKDCSYDLLLNSDPDADRLGAMALHDGRYVYLNGNEIGIVLSAFALQKRKEQGRLSAKSVIVKTAVTSSLIERIAKGYGASCKGDLLVGFKYVGEVMNALEAEGRIDDFVMGTEESHGFLAGNYARDKDAALPALWLCELAAELKGQKKTIIDYLRDIYAEYGYCYNYLTEIRLVGASGIQRIGRVMQRLRSKVNAFGDFKVASKRDYLDEKPYLSKTDESSKNVLEFLLKAPEVEQVKVTVRPSGTEPKVKFYIELLGKPFPVADFEKVRNGLASLCKQVERSVLLHAYKSIGVDFPERGFLLFWQLPLDDKMRYFAVEEELASLKGDEGWKAKASALLAFLGKDPFKKVDKAFSAKYGKGVEEYLGS